MVERLAYIQKVVGSNPALPILNQVMPQKYEYLVENLSEIRPPSILEEKPRGEDITSVLNELGRQGWELVCMIPEKKDFKLVFKRAL